MKNRSLCSIVFCLSCCGRLGTYVRGAVRIQAFTSYIEASFRLGRLCSSFWACLRLTRVILSPDRETHGILWLQQDPTPSSGELGRQRYHYQLPVGIIACGVPDIFLDSRRL